MEQIIAQQIDIIVVGNKKYELMNLMLNQELHLQEENSKSNKNSYFDALKKLIGKGDIVSQANKIIYHPVKNTNVSKFTKCILTQSFWLHLHFFVHDNRIFDPFVFESTKGSISICIVAGNQHENLTDTKNFLHNGQQSSLQETKRFLNGGMVKPETVFEGRIYKVIHQRQVNGFASVLAVKIIDQNRIVEESSNLRLNVNQILRWITDRHFQNKHKIKIKEHFGDQIENYVEKPEQNFCEIM